DTVQAAVLLAKLEVFSDEIAARQAVGARYRTLLARVATAPTISVDNTSVYAQYTVQVDNRDAVRDALNAQGIPNAVYYPVPLHRQPALQADVALPVSEAAAARVLSLPMHPYLSEQDQNTIVAALKQALNK